MAARPARWRGPEGDRQYRAPQQQSSRPRSQRGDRRDRPNTNAEQPAPAARVAKPASAPPVPVPVPPAQTAPRSWVNAATRPPPAQTESKSPQDAQSTPPPAPKSWADMAKKSVSPATPPQQAPEEKQPAEPADDASTSTADTRSTPETVETVAKEEVPPVIANAWGDKKPTEGESSAISLAAAEKAELCGNIWRLTEEALTAEEIVRQPRGLYNIGNLCFMNAVLQGLVGCSSFYRFLHSMSTLKLPKEMATLNSLITFASEFLHEDPDPPQHAIQDTGPQPKWGPPQPSSAPLRKGVPFTPDYFYDFLSTFSPTDPVRPGRGKARQEDAQEFLTYVLNLINDELAELMRGYDSGRPMTEGDADDDAAGGAGEEQEEGDDEGWLEVGARAKATAVRKFDARETPITAMFGGELKTTIRFSGSKASASLEPFLSVSLDINAREVNTLEDALRDYFAPEKLEGVFNDATRQEGKASRIVQIAKPPKVLILHLKRFRFDGATAHKVVKKIGYPPLLQLEESFLAPSFAQTGQRSYTLTAVVSHHGTKLHSGHYTVHVRQPTGDWIRLDDQKVERATESQVLGELQTAYLLLYQQATQATP